MATPLRKVAPGEPVEFRADTWNAFIDAAVAHRGGTPATTVAGGAGRPRDNVHRVRNDTGADRARFDVVALKAAAVGPSDNANEFASWPTLGGTTPAEGDGGKWGVLAEPIANGRVGHVFTSGIVPCQLWVSSSAGAGWDGVEVRNGQTSIELVEKGSGTVLWREGTASDAFEWAIVRIDGKHRGTEADELGLSSQTMCVVRLSKNLGSHLPRSETAFGAPLSVTSLKWELSDDAATVLDGPASLIGETITVHSSVGGIDNIYPMGGLHLAGEEAVAVRSDSVDGSESASRWYVVGGYHVLEGTVANFGTGEWSAGDTGIPVQLTNTDQATEYVDVDAGSDLATGDLVRCLYTRNGTTTGTNAGKLVAVAFGSIGGSALTPGCGLAVDAMDDSTWNVDPADLDGNGLGVGSGCELVVVADSGISVSPTGVAVNFGCGLKTVADVLEVDNLDLVGNYTVAEGSCALGVDRDSLATDLAGCGLDASAGTLVVDNADLAGTYLLTEGTCALGVDANTLAPVIAGLIAGNCLSATGGVLNVEISTGDGLTLTGCTLSVGAGCGITVAGSTVAVNAGDLAGQGLSTGSGTCDLQINIGSGLEFSAGAVQVAVGCGIFVDGSGVAVATDELAGDGLNFDLAGACTLDVSPGTGLEIDGGSGTGGALQVKTGCGITTDGSSALTVNTGDLSGDGLTGDKAGACTLDVDPGDGLEIEGGSGSGGLLKVKDGCGIGFEVDGSVTVNTDELAGDGLNFELAGACTLDVSTGDGLEIDGGSGSGGVVKAKFAGQITTDGSGALVTTGHTGDVVVGDGGGGTLTLSFTDGVLTAVV